MSSPGGSGNPGSSGNWNPNSAWGSNTAGTGPWAPGEQAQQHYDPLTGQPLSGGNPAGHPGYGRSGWQQQGYGAPGDHGNPGMTYQGFGIFDSGKPGTTGSPQPPEPPRKRRGPLIAAITSTVVVIVAVTTTVILINRDGDPEQPVAQQGAPPSSATTAATSPPAAAQDAVVPGWQVVTVPERGAVYDAPPGWETEDPESVIGFGPPEDPVTMTGVAIHEKGFCGEQSGSFRAISGATAREGTDDAGVAAETAGKLAELAYTVDGEKPHVTLSPPQPLQLADGTMAATRVVATVTPAAPEPCGSPSVLVSAVATNNDGNGSVVHLTVADQGVPAAIPPDVVNRIGESFRPES